MVVERTQELHLEELGDLVAAVEEITLLADLEMKAEAVVHHQSKKVTMENVVELILQHLPIALVMLAEEVELLKLEVPLK